MINIYKITNLATGECYIGQTKKPIEERLRQHFTSKDSPKLYQAILDYGRKNFTIELLETCDDNKEVANKIESSYIIKYNSIEQGYNRSVSDSQIAKEYNMPFLCERTMTIKNQVANPYSERTYMNFESLEQALIYFQINKNDLLTDSCLKKKRGANMSIYTDQQVFNTNIVSLINVYMKPKKRVPIYQYDVNLSFLKSFQSPREAAKYLDLNKDLANISSFISEVARGRKRIGYGYIWSYLNPETLFKFIEILTEGEE